METGRTLLRIGVAGLAVTHLTPLGYILILPLEDRFPQPQPPTEIAGIVLLTGGEDEWVSERRDQSLYNDAGERVMATAMLATKYPDAKIIVTGGGREDLKQAEVSARALIDMGVTKNRITVETEARNTRENAINVANGLGAVGAATNDQAGSWLLVTSAFHMPRSVGSYRMAGLDITAWPTDYRTHRSGAWSFGLGSLGLNAARTLDLAVHEWLGLAAYYARGWSDDLYPAPLPEN